MDKQLQHSGCLNTLSTWSVMRERKNISQYMIELINLAEKPATTKTLDAEEIDLAIL